MRGSGDDFSTGLVRPETREHLRVHAVGIEVRLGPDIGRVVRVDRPCFVVGTGETADLRLTDPTVSREHLRLSLTPRGVELKDEGSKNGTWIGGLRIKETLVTAPIALMIGQSSLQLSIESGPLDLPLSDEARFGNAVGVSARMRNVFALLERASGSDVTLLLEGESGVGKEVLARAVHDRSARGQGPFVTIDCSAIPAALMESELFGHEKGAFTGATSAASGVMARAEGGTIFLDEIGELPLELQPKLLRVLEQHEIRSVGSASARPLDARVIAATNRRLAEAVRAGEFRQDLFYRLAVARVTIPPLRDRPEDVVPIARALLSSAMGDIDTELPKDFASMLTAYHWPGNVRELRNVIERYLHLGVREAEVLFDSERLPDAHYLHLPYAEARQHALEAFERAYVPRAMARGNGVVARAAELSGVGLASFYRLLARVRRKRSEPAPS
jgi:transcriptional regulator with PAS, ATPase and Fis domain